MSDLYTFTLCEPDGQLVAVLSHVPALPRFLHLSPEAVCMGDQPEVFDAADPPAVLYARVASAVWVDDERTALFVRVVD